MMPWESPPERRYQSAPVPPPEYTRQSAPVPPPEYTRQSAPPPPSPSYTYQPAPPPPYQPAPPARQDIRAVIQQAVDAAIVENKQLMVDRAEAARRRAAPKKEERHNLIEGTDTVEEAFQSGAVTTMTFVRGISLDIGCALVAGFATLADGPGFSAMDKDMWMTIIPALVMKTVVQTAMSFMLKAKYK